MIWCGLFPWDSMSWFVVFVKWYYIYLLLVSVDIKWIRDLSTYSSVCLTLTNLDVFLCISPIMCWKPYWVLYWERITKSKFNQISTICCCSVASLCPVQPYGLQHPRLPCPSPTPGTCLNSCLSQWCHPTISFSANPFSCPQSFPASVSFPMSWPFASGGQSKDTQ